MTEFDLNGQHYRLGKLDAFKQFHVSRKIAPIIPSLIPVFIKIAEAQSLKDDLTQITELLGPFAEGIAGMPDEAAEYVVGTCLSVVHRQQGNGFVPMWNVQQKVCMFDDMDLSTLIPLVVRVIQDSLGGFIQGLLTSQSSPESQA